MIFLYDSQIHFYLILFLLHQVNLNHLSIQINYLIQIILLIQLI